MKYSWQLDNFDSEVFGFRVAKITEINFEDSVKNLIEELIKNKIKYATFRVQSSNFTLIHALESSGFILVDGLISLDVNIGEIQIEQEINKIREANNSDLSEIKEITKGLYLLSRIYNDPKISKDKADNFFIKWIENSIYRKVADSVLVWEEDQRILGYITLQKKGQIPLIGVSKDARGKGIAKKLLKASFNKFREWGVEKVIIETQISNIAALRVDLGCGFKPVKSFLTFRWVKND